jgi:hypothetical protein
MDNNIGSGPSVTRVVIRRRNEQSLCLQPCPCLSKGQINFLLFFARARRRCGACVPQIARDNAEMELLAIPAIVLCCGSSIRFRITKRSLAASSSGASARRTLTSGISRVISIMDRLASYTRDNVVHPAKPLRRVGVLEIRRSCLGCELDQKNQNNPSAFRSGHGENQPHSVLQRIGEYS